MTRPLNILYLHSHDTGRMVQPYGHAIPTPNIQAFAESGVLFRQAFAAAPTCSPSRAALLSGQHPHACGMLGLANAPFNWRMHDYGQHLASFLRGRGYETALSGISHVHERLPEPDDPEGYEHVLETAWNPRTEDEDEERIAEAAAEFLMRRRDRPLFMSVGFCETHRDNIDGGTSFHYDPDRDPGSADGRYAAPPPWLPDTPTSRRDTANFKRAAARLDQKVGVVLHALARSRHADDTLVILTTDHGIAWPHAKCNLTDAGLGVMLMLRGPESTGLAGGRVLDAMVSHLDLYPTICELAGLDAPGYCQGTSLMPLVRGGSETLHDELFGEQTYHHIADPMRSVRTERHKYIRRADMDHIRICDPGPTNRWMGSLGYAEQPAGTELLYDLWFDPHESHNLAASPEHAGVLDDLRGRLDRWMDATGDPFRSGEFPSSPNNPDLH